MGRLNPDSIFNPLLISMLGIIGTSIAIFLYHMVLVRYCTRRRGSAAPAGVAAGVDEKVLRTIPIYTFSAVRGENTNQDEECAVCLGELEDDDEVRLLPNCEHAFHVTCVDRWFAAHATCPLCRSPVALDPQGADPSVGAVSGSDRGSGGVAASSLPPLPPRAESRGLVRHWSSVVVEAPAERRWMASPPRLKRSVSMDLVIGLRNIDCLGPSSSPCNLSHFNRVSSKLRRSFSRLRVGKAGHGPILPY